MPSEAQDGRREIEAVVRISYHLCWYTRAPPSSNRMSGDSEKAPVISSWVWETHVEVPVVRCSESVEMDNALRQRHKR